MSKADSLALAARDQQRWSLTANKLKTDIGRARWAILILAVAAATLETLGAQIHQAHGTLALWFGFAGALALVFAGIIRQQGLSHTHIQAWIIVRAGSESFKREMYLFRTSTGEYTSGNPAETLLNRRDNILSRLRTFEDRRLDLKDEVKTPGTLDADGYLNERINGQVDFYNNRAHEYLRTQKSLRVVELGLTFIAAILSMVVTITGQQAFGAWVAVITTITGAIGAHSLAQRYEQLTISYRATAERLEGIVGRWKVKQNASIADLVVPCESALLEGNQGWITSADDTTIDKEIKNSQPLPNANLPGN